jgi:NitT/TauT family transport system ATP-binding protein
MTVGPSGQRLGARAETAPGQRPDDDAPAVRVDGVSVTFATKRQQVTALEAIDLDVGAGEFVSIVGPSGCGKSTLLKVVAGLVRPSSGTTTLLGSVVDTPRQDIGFVFQRAALLEWRSARRNVLLQAEMRGMPRADAARRADELIAMTGLSGFENALPHELSGGMQQRVSLCRALLHRPPVLLMDEPFGALDALTREQMNVELHRIWRETGTTVLFVTHSIAEAAYLARRVAVMSPRPGRVLEVVDVDLPRDRDYASVMRSPEFGAATAHIRSLLGAQTDH